MNKGKGERGVRLLNCYGFFVFILFVSLLAIPINSLIIGGSTSSHFNGIIDEFYVYNRALVPEQVQLFFSNETNVLHFNETQVNDTWQVCATPNDGFIDGATNCTNQVLITDFSAVLAIALSNPAVSFSLVHQSNTTAGPMVIINNGTVNMDVAMCAETPLFPSIGLNTSNFQAKVVAPAGTTVDSVVPSHNIVNCTTPFTIVNNLATGESQFINVSYFVYGNTTQAPGEYSTDILFLASQS